MENVDRYCIGRRDYDGNDGILRQESMEESWKGQLG